MASTLKLLGTVAVLCMTAIGLLFAFNVVTLETVAANSIQVVGGIAVLVVTVVSLKAISGRGPGGGKTDPPPTL